jgi:hypothetical protein
MYKVYLIECDNKYKIGYTRKSIDQRIKQMKTGNSGNLNLISFFESKWGTKIESHLHRKFKSKKVSGEWFELDENDVLTFELQCQEWHNVMEDITNNSTWVLNKKYL